jgi:hypothetical protein
MLMHAVGTVSRPDAAVDGEAGPDGASLADGDDDSDGAGVALAEGAGVGACADPNEGDAGPLSTHPARISAAVARRAASLARGMAPGRVR